MPLRGASVVLSIAVIGLKTPAVPWGHFSGVVGAPIRAGVSQENEQKVLLGDINHHQLRPVAGELNAKIEELDPAQNDTAVSLCITWPVNDTVLPVGEVVLVFERRGFPSRQIPIEVLVPQNGESPALMTVESNNFVLSTDIPYTQLVTIFATVHGQRVSSAVMFSTVLDKATIASARAPLPADAAWGPRSEAVASPLRDLDDPGKSRVPPKSAGFQVPKRRENTLSFAEGPSSPISLVFLGSLDLDGQKHIWLQQLERLSRARFAPKYLTFHEDDESKRAHSVAEEVVTPSKADDVVEVFKRRLHDAGVPVLRARPLRMHSSCISERDGDKSTDKKRREVAMRAVIESIDSAGGDPHLMSPPWTREFFLLIADAIKSASPDVLVIANSVTLGDVVLTRAARWAMDNRGLKIVMDFPNLNPTHGVDVDLLVTPSHYVARHPDLAALAESTRARVVVIPPGIEVASSATEPVEEGVNDARRFANRSGGLHGLACSNHVLADLGCRDPVCHVVGFVGRLAPEKGPGLFLAVAEVLAKLLPCAVFVIVGDGPLRLALEAMAERLGLARRVHFVGWVDGVDLEYLLAEMSLLFNPSLMSHETFSIVNIQAMAVGTPVASFGIGGMLEYLSPDVNALVLDEAEPEKVAPVLAELLLDRGRLAALAERGKTHILSNFGADAAVERWAELYESLVDVR